jgi:acetyl esterase/lipase
MRRSANGKDPKAPERSEPDAQLIADLTLRFGGARLPGRVYWPHLTAEDADSPLILLLTDTDATGGVESADVLSRLLCSAAATVVLAVPSPSATSSVEGSEHDYEIAALGWAADHAAALGAHPQRLLVAGQDAAGARAAWLAIRARDNGWPRLRRQVLVHPTFSTARPIPSLLAAVAPATVITSGTPNDDGSRYAALLRASGIEVDELRHRHPIRPGHDHDLAVVLSELARPARLASRQPRPIDRGETE